MVLKRNYKKKPAPARIYGQGAYRTTRRAPVRRAPSRMIRGKGGYWSDIGRGLTSVGGAVLGGLAGGPAGALAGLSAGALAGQNIFGKGAYRVKKNTILTPSSVPAVHSDNDSVRVFHKEYICDIVSSQAFALKSYSVNPGLSASFPWLSGVAGDSFSQFDIQGMVYYFKSTCGDTSSSTNSLGTVSMCAEYNVNTPAFSTKQQMENSMFCASGKPTQDIMAPIECDDRLNVQDSHYIRTGPVPTGGTLSQYDHCNMMIATSGQQADDVVIGELWCTYDIILRKSILNNTNLGGGSVLHYAFDSTLVPTASLPFNGKVACNSTNLVYESGSKISWPAGVSGTYKVICWYKGTSAVLGFPTSVVLVNATRLDLYQFGSQDSNDTRTSDVFFYMFCFNITNPSVAGSLTVTGGTYPTSITASDLFIVEVPNTIA